MLPGITGKSTLSATAHEKHRSSLLFRAGGKHSCCPRDYRKIHLHHSSGWGTSSFWLSILREIVPWWTPWLLLLQPSRKKGFFHPSFLPSSPSLFPFLTSLTLTKSWQLTQMAETLHVRVEEILQMGPLWVSFTSETPEQQQPQLQAASLLMQQRAHGACSNFQNQGEKWAEFKINGNYTLY